MWQRIYALIVLLWDGFLDLPWVTELLDDSDHSGKP